jgi:thymidine phosphorylase
MPPNADQTIPAAQIIRNKRDRRPLSGPEIRTFVSGIVDGSWGEGQIAAMAMAIILNGMNGEETIALTRAMTASGQTLDWREAALNGPILDKHSTGGVGDKVSLLLAPIAAACGAVVPMISGRGLDHTGGTLDKLEALPGYTVAPPREVLLRTLRHAGCAIIGASAELAPADRRLYAIRDITATVESIPLITASILSKKLAAGLQGLVMDVKLGNGAFMATLDDARTLAHSLVEVAQGAGLPCRALITDMNQILGHSAGNAVEVAESIAFLVGTAREPRLLELTLELAAQMLVLGGLAADLVGARTSALAALESGRAAECFARMVSGLGGPPDVLRSPGLLSAPVQLDLPAPTDGVLRAVDTRALGAVIVGLGGGRWVAGQAIDHRVGLSHVVSLGTRVRKGQPLMRVHAATQAQALRALRMAQSALQLDAAGTIDSSPCGAPMVFEIIGRGT